MGQCLCRKKDSERQSVACQKQDKNIDDKRMFKLGIDVLNRDFCIQIGYNRKAVKTYGQRYRVASLSPTPEDPTQSSVVS